GHIGVTKTLNKLRERFYWVHCQQDVRSWCRKCDICAARKGPTRRVQAPLQQYNIGVPIERVVADILGPLPTTDTGNCYLLIAMDYFSKWPEAYPLKNQETITVAEALVNQFFTKLGVPAELHIKATIFESEVFRNMCRLFRIHKTCTTHCSQSDGMVESLETLVMPIQDHQRDWDQYIPLLLMAYRTAVNETTKCTPALIMFGRELCTPIELLFGSPEDEGQSLSPRRGFTENNYAEELQKKIHLTDASIRMKRLYDVGTSGKIFQKGDLVWLYNPQRRKGRSPKLSRAWEGPYKVLHRITDVVYWIQYGPRTKPKVIHRDRLWKY
uniref:Gypsy retrotransposon integrase-like protein 1 n=1 Tax=Latimeria chalumnae TaxID=7897 RepID=H3AH72_LATCH